MVAGQRLRALVQKYVRPGPRYTSYPTAAEFGPLPASEYEARLARARQATAEACSAYVHVPFCAKRCGFCACSVIATTARARVEAPYVDHLVREIELVGERLGERRRSTSAAAPPLTSRRTSSSACSRP